MADYIIDDAVLTAIADNIREKTKSTDLIVPEEMPSKVNECYERGLAARTYETWTITYADGTVEEKEVALL